jgi:hypothetical protein
MFLKPNKPGEKMKLRRYWFQFDIPNSGIYPLGLLAGCGVTAYNYDDALELLQKKFLGKRLSPLFKK